MARQTYRNITTGGGSRPTSSTGPRGTVGHVDTFESVSTKIGPAEQTKIRLLQGAIKNLKPIYGYEEVLEPNGEGLSYYIKGPLGRNKVHVDRLLLELEHLAFFLKINPKFVYESMYGKKSMSKDPPDWLHIDGKSFWNSVVNRELRKGWPLATGGYCRRFGQKIRFTLSLKDPFKSMGGEIKLETRERETQEYIVWAHVSNSETKLEAFKYLPTDSNKYGSKLRHGAAMDFNRSMYAYVELKKMAPSDAYEKWITENKKFHEAVLTLIAVSFAGP